MLYGSELWASRKAEQQLNVITEIRMLLWIYGVSRMLRIKGKGEIREGAGIANASYKM